MKKKTLTAKETEVLRLTRYFSTLLKTIAKDYYLQEQWFDSKTYYTLQEQHVVTENVSSSFISLKTIFKERDLIKVTLKIGALLSLSEHVSLPVLILKGGFSLQKPISGKHDQDSLFVSDYWVKVVE